MRGGKIEGKEGTKGGSSEAEIATDIVTTISVAEEANASLAGANKACSDRGSRKNECGDGEGTRTGDRGVSQKRCYELKSLGLDKRTTLVYE